MSEITKKDQNPYIEFMMANSTPSSMIQLSGNREGLIELRNVIDKALENGNQGHGEIHREYDSFEPLYIHVYIRDAFLEKLLRKQLKEFENDSMQSKGEL